MEAVNGAVAVEGAVEGQVETQETQTPAVAVKKPRVSAEKLIEALNKAESIKEAAALTGLTENNIHQRRHQLALKGIKVKQYAGSRGGNRLDIAKLQELAASTLPEGAEVFVATTRTVEAPKAPEAPAGEGAEAEQTASAS